MEDLMKVRVNVRQPFAYDADKVSEDTGLSCMDETRTQQHAAEECDINVLVKRFGLVGQMPPNHRVAMYQDFEEVFDYHDSMNRLREADVAFMAMPPDVRSRFGNSPQALMEFLADDNNRAEVKRMGLLAPDEVVDKPILVKMEPVPQPVNPTPKSEA